METSSLRPLKIMARNLNEVYVHEFGIRSDGHKNRLHTILAEAF
jgi:hypothetical protein